MTSDTLVCPACQAPYTPSETVCAVCGLLFASQTGTPGQTGASPAGSLPPIAAGRLFEPLYPGQRLSQGRYTVQRILTRGGMGALAIASDADAFDRTVVIKALLDYHDPNDPQEAREARERFVQEARTLSELRHPAIPQIYAYFQEGGQNYIVMEYIEGHDLEQGLTVRGDGDTEQPGAPYPRERVLRWGVAVCRILEYLAGHKPDPVVHHDIKPANLLLDRNSGDVRLVDFGTARKRPVAGGGRAEPGFGTPGYAPPEQYRGQGEPRSDVYALAATLYHLATDDDPRDHPFSFPQLDELGDLGVALRGALDREVSRRPGAAELRGALEALLRPDGLPPIEAPDGTRLADSAALLVWCEQHWSAAAIWMARGLPQQLEVRWGQTWLAHQLHELLRKHHNDGSAALDAGLALLDPEGFGQEGASLMIDPAVLDFGVFSTTAWVERTLYLRNTSRRHATVRLMLPLWITTPRPIISLPPGESASLRVSGRAEPGVDFAVPYSIQVVVGSQQYTQISTTAGLSRLVRLHHAGLLRWVGGIVLVGLVLACLLRPVLFSTAPASVFTPVAQPTVLLSELNEMTPVPTNKPTQEPGRSRTPTP